MMPFIHSLSLRAKIALIVSAVLLLAMIVASQVAASLLARQMQRDSLEELRAKTRQIVDNIELLDHVLRRTAATLASGLDAYFPGTFALPGELSADGIPLLQSGAQNVNGEAARLEEFKAKTGAEASLLVRSGDDFVRVATTLKTAKGEAAVGTVLERGVPAYAALIAGRSYEGTVVVFDRYFMTKYSPLKDAAGKVIGARVVGFDTMGEIERLKEGLRRQKLGASGYFSIIDVGAGARAGRAILAAPEKDRAAAQTPDDQRLLDAVLAAADGTLRLAPANGEGEQVHVFARAPSWQWAVVATAPAAELFRGGTLLRRLMLLTALTTGLVLGLLVYASVDRFVTRPLRGLLGFANRIARGDLSARDAGSYAADETGALLKAFNAMRDRLAQVVASVRGGADSVTSAANQIASSSRELSIRTEAQANSSAQVVAMLEELTATVKQTAANAGNADTIANQAAAAAVQGNAHVSTMVETMLEIQRSSTRITDVVGVIDSIAFQTNILALNAAVEAARAGEHGRGFSVVASEVRALAQRAGQSAREIKQLIAAAADSTGNGASRVSEASRAIGEILVAIEKVAALVREISVAALQQSRALEQVNQTVTQMDYVTQQNATIVTQYAAAAQQLAQHAAALTRAVAVFKLADGAAELVQVAAAPVQSVPLRSQRVLPIR